MKIKTIDTPRGNFEFYTSIITLLCTAAGMLLSLLSYSTGYYVFGEMNSILVCVFIMLAFLMELANLMLERRYPHAAWPQCITFFVTSFLILALVFHIGDRFEGIGNCIVTDYDSGHGGEQAIYFSIAACVLLLVGSLANIIGSFRRTPRPEQSEG